MNYFNKSGADLDASQKKKLSRRQRKNPTKDGYSLALSDDDTTSYSSRRASSRYLGGSDRFCLEYPQSRLDTLAKFLKKGVPIKSNKGLVHHYENSFRGYEAVQWMVCNSVCSDVQDAVNLLRHLVSRRVLLRVDHTKPVLNSFVNNIAPSFAEWRVEKRLSVFQHRRDKYHKNGLYVFNVISFARYKIKIKIMKSRDLKYSRQNKVTRSIHRRKIAPYIKVSIGTQEGTTAVASKTDSSDILWDEEFQLFVDKDDEAGSKYVWLKVYDFRELGNSLPLGVLCIPVSRIVAKCCPERGTLPKGQPLRNDRLVPWSDWHPLKPPATAKDPEEVSGGELQVEFKVRQNIVPDPELTVYEECRNRGGDSTGGSQQISDGRISYFGSPTLGGAPLRRLASDEQVELYNLNVKCIDIKGVTDITTGATYWVELCLRKSDKVISTTKTAKFEWPKPDHLKLNGAIPVKASDLKVSQLETRLCKRIEGNVNIKFVAGKGKTDTLSEFEKLIEIDASEMPNSESGLGGSDDDTDEGEEEECQLNIRVSLRRQAAFKKTHKKKVGYLEAAMYLTPASSSISETVNELDDDVEIEAPLHIFQDGKIEEEDNFDAPEPLKNPLVSGTANAGIERLSIIILSASSKFDNRLAKLNGYTDYDCGPWITGGFDSFRRVRKDSPQSQMDEESVEDTSTSRRSMSYDDTPPYRIVKLALPDTKMMKGGKAEIRQELVTATRKGFVMESTTKLTGVPYCDTFNQRTQLFVEAIDDKRCKIRVSGETVWIAKPPFIKNLLVSEAKKGAEKNFSNYLGVLADFTSSKKSKDQPTTPVVNDPNIAQPQESFLRKWLYLLLAALVLLMASFVAYMQPMLISGD